MEADRSKLDVLDFIINILKEHTEKICGAAEILEQVAKHSLDAEKLNKLEEVVVFWKAEYEEGLDTYIPVSRVLEDLDKLLGVIQK